MMKIKTVFSLLLLIATITMAEAQNQHSTNKVKYQGEVFTGFGAGVGDFDVDRVYIQTIHGIRVGRYFSTGVGIGVNIVPSYVYGYTEAYMPIYLNTKGYLPLNRRSSLFLSLDLGHSFGVSKGVSDLNGFLCTPAIGISIVNRVNISLGYECQQLSTEISGFAVKMNALAIKVGFNF